MKDNKDGLFGFIKPIIVLVAICIVVSGLLALTNSVTAPIIDEQTAAAAQATRLELMPNAKEFTELECDVANVKSVYKDNGGSGYVIAAVGKGYKGDVTVTVALNNDGSVIAIKVDSSGETPNVGTKTMNEDFTSRFAGLSESASDVQPVSGASVSSKAVKSAVNSAFEAFAAVKEG